MCAEHHVRDEFDRLAGEYDDLKLRVLPGYREVQELALRYASAPATKRVLELGCGTAEWASTFLLAHPAASYAAVEFSPKMRGLASRRLERYSARVQILDQDLDASLPGGPFDRLVSGKVRGLLRGQTDGRGGGEGRLKPDTLLRSRPMRQPKRRALQPVSSNAYG